MSDTKSFKTVMLLRSRSGKDEDDYSQLSNRHNFHLINLPVLTFNFTNSDDLLRELNDNHQNYEALVFTSQRAVEAVEFILPQIDNFSEKWSKNKLCYVVGEETASKVKSSLNWELKNILGSEAGNALKLADAIIAKYKNQTTKPLLFPCGNLKRNELEQSLMKHEIQLKPVISYETIPRKDISDAIAQLKLTSLEYVVFFSPSGVKNVYDVLRKYITGFEDQTKVIAIGPTTAKTLSTEFDCHNVLVAEKPNAESVMHLIENSLLIN
jgi:uroporphyrinogen-III synthase